ncbi:MAG: MgtC/SapB family protein [Oscillospiraceae bacterium]
MPTTLAFSGGPLAPLRDLNMVSVLFRFALATLCGSVIGLERGKRKHAAGLRTHIVVCIGAAAAMLVNQYISIYLAPGADPARMGAQVISGIGFLGAGTIMITGHHRGQQIKGLTTAAGLWASACMGLFVGIGFYEGAVVMCAFLFAVIAVLNQLDARYLKSSASLRLYLEYSPSIAPFSAILRALRSKGWHLTHIEYLSHEACNDVAVLLEIQRSRRPLEPEDTEELLRGVEGVLFVEDV